MAHHHRFRFGVVASLSDRDADWRERGERAETLGYDTLLVSDHIGARLAPLPTLVAVADATATLRVGTLVLANDFRHPALLAMEAATVDLLSGGRFELGLGTGWLAEDYDALGRRLAPGGTRIERLEEALDILDGAWSGEPVTHRGAHYTVDLSSAQQPAQRPRPPLLLAGSGRRMLSVAGRRGDIVSITATVGAEDRTAFWSGVVDAGDLLERRVSWVREAAESRPDGRGFDDVELNVLVHEVEVTDDPAGAARRLAGDVPGDPMRILTSPHVLAGPVEAIIDTLVERRSRHHLSYVVVFVDAMEDFAPVVAALAGE